MVRSSSSTRRLLFEGVLAPPPLTGGLTGFGFEGVELTLRGLTTAAAEPFELAETSFLILMRRSEMARGVGFSPWSSAVQVVSFE